LFTIRTPSELVEQFRSTARPEVMATATRIVDDVRDRGESGVRDHAARLDGLESSAPLVIGRAEMRAAMEALPPDERARLTRIADRIRAFADGQRQALRSFEMAVPGGMAGHTIAPVCRAGCYAPGGRYPLPSSLLMTAITARAAGVSEVWVASPRRDPIMLACAALADADGFLGVGGAQAIGALAFGAGEVPPCDVVVGPGNAYVTAAKRVVFGQVGIDSLAGPSELVVVAGDESDPKLVAADLLAQAEHDPESIPVLVSLSESLVRRVTDELEVQLETLSTAGVARAALGNGGAIVVADVDEAITVCDDLAPEHLHLHVADAASIARRFRNYGALFVGEDSAEVLGDYGAGPNHVLPTGRVSRFTGGLSVLTFLRVRTWLAVHDTPDARELYEDAAWLGRVEGLEAHARSAEQRSGSDPDLYLIRS
jgi:phosphoribosyl-ATP pyrophosphohydrolase/phosphoribosyl-AMP cyclohydrolase/histidinol dehydrogenase